MPKTLEGYVDDGRGAPLAGLPAVVTKVAGRGMIAARPLRLRDDAQVLPVPQVIVAGPPFVLPVRSSSALAAAPISLSALVVIVSTSGLVEAPVSAAQAAEAPTSTASHRRPSSTSRLV